MPDSTTPDLLDLAGKLVGVWGGGLASFLAWRQWRRERNPLSITIGPGSDSADPAAPAFRVRVANRGPRRVTIEDFGLGCRVDYRRVHPVTFGGWRTRIEPLRDGHFRLDTSDLVDAFIGQYALPTLLYGRQPTFVHSDAEAVAQGAPDGYWEGDPPFRLAYLWARDVTGQFYKAAIRDRDLVDWGYNSWDDAPPILRGRLTALWYRFCMALWENERVGFVGWRVVNLLHRLRLFPTEVGQPPTAR